MSWQTPSSPTESSHRNRSSSDVLCSNMSDIEKAPSTPMGLSSKYKVCRVEFVQSAAASSTAPLLLIWQSRNPNNARVNLELSLSMDAKTIIFAMLKCEFEMSSSISELI